MGPRTKVALASLAAIASLALAWLWVHSPRARSGSAPRSSERSNDAHVDELSSAEPSRSADERDAPSSESEVAVDRSGTSAPAPIAVSGAVWRNPVNDKASGGQVDVAWVDLASAGLSVQEFLSSSPEERARFEAHATSAIGSDGRYRIEVPPGSFLRAARMTPPEDEVDLRRSFLAGEYELGVSIDADMQTEHQLWVDIGVTLTGRVVESGSRAPIAGVVLTPEGFQGSGVHGRTEVTTDEAGAFRLALAYDPRWLRSFALRLEHPDFPPRREEIANPTFLVALDQLEFELERGAIVHGRVVDADGAGVAAGLIAMRRATSPSELGTELDLFVTSGSGPDGSFRFAVLPRSTTTIVARSPLHGEIAAGPFDLRGDLELELRFPRSVLYEIVASVPDGTRAPPDRVSVFYADREGHLRAATMFGTEGPTFAWSAEAPCAFTVFVKESATRAGEPAPRLFRGSGIASYDGVSPLSGPEWMRTVRVAVTVEPWSPARAAHRIDGIPACGMDPLDDSFAWTLRAVDASTREPLQQLGILDQDSGGLCTAPLVAGALRVSMAPGVHHLEFRSPGYRSRALELVIDPDGISREALLALTPRR